MWRKKRNKTTRQYIPSTFERKEFKIKQSFSPNPELLKRKTLLQENLKKKPQKITLRSELQSFLQYLSLFWITVKLFISRQRLAYKLLKIVSIATLFSLITFVFYIGFVDNYFLLKNITLRLSYNSYLSRKDAHTLLETFYTTRILGIAPLNSYWFANTDSLTRVIQSKIPQIRLVEVTSRTWPDTIELTIHTDKPLVILRDNTNRNYAIGTDGSVLGSSYFDVSNDIIILQSSMVTDMKMVPEPVLQKIWQTRYVKSIMNSLDIPHNKVIFSSLLSIDPDWYIELTNGTRILFSWNELSKDNLKTRIEKLLSSELREQIVAGKISQIDLRFAKTVYICYYATQCDTVQ